MALLHLIIKKNMQMKNKCIIKRLGDFNNNESSIYNHG